MIELKETFRPEFLNRLDEIIIFNPLAGKEIEKIVDLQLEILKKRLAEKGINAAIDDSLKNYLAKEGFDAEYGARPIKRLIQKFILNNLADRIIRGELKNAKKLKSASKSLRAWQLISALKAVIFAGLLFLSVIYWLFTVIFLIVALYFLFSADN